LIVSHFARHESRILILGQMGKKKNILHKYRKSGGRKKRKEEEEPYTNNLHQPILLFQVRTYPLLQAFILP